MVDEYQRLVDANERLTECKGKASSRDSLTELQEWLNQKAPASRYGESNLFMDTSGFNQVDMSRLLLPDAGMLTGKAGNELTPPLDRKYRQSVYLQQQMARGVSKWHNKTLHVMRITIYKEHELTLSPQKILQRHQDRSESVKKVFQRVVSSHR
jgi:hypothetical protein